MSYLEDIGSEINEINITNGWDVPVPEDWHEEHRVPTLLALLHSEVSEALEAFRKEDFGNFEEELADVFIRLLDMTYGMEIDLEIAVEEKLARNRTRGYRHGGKKV